MNIYNRIKGYIIYKKVIRENWGNFKGPNFKMTKDWVNSIGTVINLPVDITLYDPNMATSIVHDYVKKCEKQFFNLGIYDMILFKEAVKIDDYNYKIVFSYKNLSRFQILSLNFLLYLAIIGILLSIIF
jgi:hypothetical protein